MKSFDELGGIEAALGGEPVPMTSEQVREVEAAAGAELPASYRSFLLTYGSCKFGSMVICRPQRRFDGGASAIEACDVDFFFGATRSDGRGYALEWAMQVYEGRVPPDLLPIGGDLSGGLLCLGKSGEVRGRVFYWDPADEWDPDDEEEGDDVEALRFRNVHLLAESFDEFLSRLEVHPDA